MCNKKDKPLKLIKVQAKPTKTFKRVWPAIILQKSRIAKLKGLKIYPINSTGTNKKANATEVPEGKNKEKNSNLCVLTQIIFIPIKIVKLNDNVAKK
jgi:hypothetical protein